MAKNISSIKKTTTGSGKLIKRIAAISISLLIIIFSFIYLNNVDKAARDTITVVRIKSADLPAYSIISKDNVEKYDIIKKEYNDDKYNGMILFEEIDDYYGLLSAYFIRGGTFLYKNQLITERPQRNEWLYELLDDYEVVTIPYNYMEAGGEILLPGDQIRIRIIYEDDAESTDDYYDTNPNYGYSNSKVMKSEILFDSIVVSDMINSNARSIYEIYNEVIRLSEKDRQEVMKSSEFMSSIKPKALLLEATADQIDAYALYKKSAGSGNFLITILSRANSRVILDQLPMLESEVNSWLKEKQGN